VAGVDLLRASWLIRVWNTPATFYLGTGIVHAIDADDDCMRVVHQQNFAGRRRDRSMLVIAVRIIPIPKCIEGRTAKCGETQPSYESRTDLGDAESAEDAAVDGIEFDTA